MCPVCKRRWRNENAEANGFCCFRSCDTPLVHMEEEAGPHLDYLDTVRLGAASGITDLREAILAVRPGGTIELPPGRYREPLVLDKPLRLMRSAGDGGEVFLEAHEATVVRVVSEDVELIGMTIFKAASRGNFPLIEVRSGALSLRDCRLDCRRAPGVLVRGSALLKVQDCAFHHSAGYALRAEAEASLELSGLRLNGSGPDGGLTDAAEAGEGAGTPLSVGVGLSIEPRVAVAIASAEIREYPLGVLLKGASGRLHGLDIRDCDVAARFVDADHLQVDTSRFTGSGDTLIEAVGGAMSLAECIFTGGGEQLVARDCGLTIERCTFLEPDRAACLLEREVTGAVRNTAFGPGDGNGVLVGRSEDLAVENCTFDHLAGMAVLALEGAAPKLTNCSMDDCGVGICALAAACPTVGSDTRITGSGGSGVILQEGAGGVFDGLTIAGSTADHFVVGRSALGIRMTGCTFENGRAGGLRLADGARAIAVELRVTGGTGSGVILGESARARLEHATIDGCGDYGLLLCPNAELDVVAGDVANCRNGGLWAVRATAVRLNGAHIHDNGQCGLFLDRVVAITLVNVALSGNRGPGLAVCGVAEGSERGRLSATDCALKGNQGEGALILGRVEAEMRGGEFADNGLCGVRTFGSALLDLAGCLFYNNSSGAARVGRWASAAFDRCTFAARDQRLLLDSDSRTTLTGNLFPGKWRKSVKKRRRAALQQENSRVTDT